MDLALRYMGSAEGLIELLDANPLLQLDATLPAGISVVIPRVINRRVVDYFDAYDLDPATGIDQEIVITQNDMNSIKQDVNYDLSQGSKEFDRVQLFFLRDLLTIQIHYSDISTDTVSVTVDQSLDGINWTAVPTSGYTLSRDVDTHTYNIIGLLTNFVRVHVSVPDATTGTIDHIIFKT